jgi:outer membrane protein assembly factor BamA
VSFRLLLILIIISTISVAQTQKESLFYLKVNYNNDLDHIGKYIKYNHSPLDSSKTNTQIQDIQASFYQESYFFSTIENVLWKKDSCIVFFNVGPKFHISKLLIGNFPEWMLRKVDFKESYFKDKVFNPLKIATLFKRTLKYAQDNGYPFSSIKLDSIVIVDNNLTAKVDFKIGPVFKFDTLLIVGKSKINRRFLENYLRIESKQWFSQEKLNNIERAIKQLPYLSMKGPIAVYFNEGLVRVEIPLEDKKASQVDGIVGLLPNSKKDGGVLLTGEFNLVLRNLFHSGKMLKGDWKRFQEESQLLNLEYTHSNLFHSDYDVSIAFNFLKQDSTFLNLNRKASVFYRLNGSGKVSLSLGYISSRIGTTKLLKFATVLPSYADFEYLSYGLGYDYNSLDNLFYPRRGILLKSDFAIGNKTIIKNSIFNDNLYKNINLKSLMLIGNFSIEKYFRLANNSILLLKTVGGKVLNQNIFINDLYRLGGLKSLRGFNDNFFYASDYSINTVEFRQFIDETSFLLLFAEQSYVYYNLGVNKLEDYPIGIGAGISFTSGPGIFSFVYSVGKSKQQQMSLNQSKIHFGFVSRF